MNVHYIRMLLQKQISDLGLDWYITAEQNTIKVFGPNRDLNNEDLIGRFEVTSSSVFLISSTTKKTELDQLSSLQNEILAAIEDTKTPSHVGTGTLDAPEYNTVPVIVIASAILGLITVICLGLIVGYSFFG